ncbi:MAG: inositol monophosphatase [Deltaproteobacteria bacterium]|nr:inositol monophosphatase [Deltaproteobacteria bacterium]
MKSFFEVAKQAALASGQLQLDNLLKEKQIEFKGEINLVTHVDKLCEKEIIAIIQGAFPSHDILAEEGGGNRQHSDYRWVIDPIDGTTNYAHAYPLFSTSIGLEYKGEIILGVVYEPNLKEMFIAEKGSGAFCNGQKIAVSSTKILKQSLLVTGFAYNLSETGENNIVQFEKFLMNAQAVRRDGVASTDLCDVAMGRYDGFWELALQPWDVAAGLLIVEEAGGRVSNYQGKRFSIYEKQMLASNSLLHDAMLKILNS